MPYDGNPGPWIFIAGSNTGLSGPVTINMGQVNINNANALGSGTITLNGGSGNDGNNTCADISIWGDAAAPAAPAWATMTLSNNFIIGPNGGTFGTAANYAAGTLDLTGQISGPGTLTVAGGGSNPVYLYNANNTWSGGTDLNTGVLYVAAGANMGPGPVLITNGGSLNLQGTTNTNSTNNIDLEQSWGYNDQNVLNVSAASATIGTLSGNGRVELNNNQWQGMTTLTFGNAGSSSFYGYIQDGGSGNAGSLIYAGTGTFTLWGEDDLHGTTTINSGTFVNNGIIGVPGVGNAGVIVNSGATLTGSGQITGTLSVSGGIANMTGATIGTLSVTSYGTATLTGATINGAITINTEGSVSLTNSTVNGALTDGPPGGGAYYATFTGNGNTINGNVVVYDGATSAGSSFIGNNNTINGSLIVGHITAGRPAAVFSGNNNVINSPSYDVQINTAPSAGAIQSPRATWTSTPAMWRWPR